MTQGGAVGTAGERGLRVHVATLGCRTNLADALVLEDELRRRGAALTGADEAADIVIVNSCTVTHNADADARKIARRFKRRNPDARVVVTGCYAQVAPEALRAIPEIDDVVGNDAKAGLVAALWSDDEPPRDGHAVPAEALRIAKRLATGTNAGDHPAQTSRRREGRAWRARLRPAQRSATAMPESRTRPFLKVQDGCDYSCAFCIIPKARGVSRSTPLDVVLRDAMGYADLGAREIALTGIHLGHWGRDMTPREPFAALVERLADALAEDGRVRRLRIGSVEPNEVTPELIALLRDHPVLCDHIHVPLQSGDDATLRRMRRLYRARQWAETVEALREALPDAAIGADVLVGHPGEDEASFERTVAFLASTPWTYLHVFPFSARRGTPAAAMDAQVPPQSRNARVQALTRLSGTRRAAFHEARVGRRFEAIVLNGRGADGSRRALTRNFIPVSVAPSRDDRPRGGEASASEIAPGDVLDVRLTASGAQRCRAEVVS